VSDDDAPDPELVLALRALLAADEAGTPFDNEQLSKALGWDLTRTGDCLKVAKDQSLIWASRGSRLPGPWFSEIEVTMQGRRLLRGLD
jgi:hypothetical protein